MKNKLFFALLLLISYSASYAQGQEKQYHINGYFKNIQTPNGYVYLQGNIGDSAKSKIDSAKLVDGHFSFSGKAEPNMAKVYTKRLGHPHMINPASFFIDGGNINIQADYDTTEYTWLNNVKVTGSATNDEFTKLNETIKKEVYDEYDAKSMQEDYRVAQQKNDTAALRMLTEKGKEMYEKQMDIQLAYIKKHPKSYIGIYYAMQMAYTPDEKVLNSAKEIFLGLDPSLQFSYLGRRTSDRLAFASKGMLMNKPAGDFAQPTASGKLIKLSDYKGKYVLLDFWASWCGPCRAENPNVLAAYKKYKDKGFDVLAVSLDDNMAKWEKAIAEDKLPWTQVSDLKQSKNAAVVQFGVSGIPDNFLIDPNGIVIGRGLRGAELDRKLEEIFK